MSTESTVGSVPVGGFGAVAAAAPAHHCRTWVLGGSDRARRASGALAVRRRAERRHVSGVLDPWFRHLSEQGFAGLADEFSNYTPYLVLLWLATNGQPDRRDQAALGDVRRTPRVLRVPDRPGSWPASSWLPVLITGLVLLLATVLLNSSTWVRRHVSTRRCAWAVSTSCCIAGPGRPAPSSVWPSRSSSRRSSCCRCWWAS